MGIKIDKSFSYLTGKFMQDYLTDMKVAQEFATLSRKEMAIKILDFFGKEYSYDDISFETIHNYYSFKDNIIRKGAISAYENERILIPINMRDGSILGRGKGNADWNFSGPHGAGRLFSRKDAKERLSLDEFKSTMSDVWTSCVSQNTLDESPMAYKDIDSILKNIDDNIIVDDILKPIYNFKGVDGRTENGRR